LTKIQIRKWKDIQADFKENLLLGNGASIAIFDKFNYGTLHSVAEKENFINSKCIQLFKDFETDNFEHILKVLADANMVNQILQIHETATNSSYNEIKNALVNTIRHVHPQRDSVSSLLLSAGDFMSKFKTIISLNYDLLVYWAILLFNTNNNCSHFKDCFIPKSEKTHLFFESDYDYLRNSISGSTDASLIFYPHGNIILANSPNGAEVKLVRNDEYVLDTILAKWSIDKYYPLIVSESDSKHKLLAIEHSNYLTNVYNRVLSALPQTLVIYGWSFSNADFHILKALERSISLPDSNIPKRLEHLAISVHTSNPHYQSFCERVQEIIEKSHLRKINITWFDSTSSGCWVNK
jgi:hypothetical protein